MRQIIFTTALLLVCFLCKAQKQVTYLECDGKFFPLVNGVPDYSTWTTKSSVLAQPDTVIPQGNIIWNACTEAMIDDAVPATSITKSVLYTSPRSRFVKVIITPKGYEADLDVTLTDADGNKVTIDVIRESKNRFHFSMANLSDGVYHCIVIQNGDKLIDQLITHRL